MGRDNGHSQQGDHDQDLGMDHWTVGTNHHRRSLRSKLHDNVVEHLKRTIVQALERGEEPHAGETFPKFRVRKNPEPHPGLLSVTLFHETAGAVLYLYINAGGGPKPEAWAHAWRNGNAPEPMPARCPARHQRNPSTPTHTSEGETSRRTTDDRGATAP